MLPMFMPAVLITLVFFLSGFEKIYRFPMSSSKFSKKVGLPLALGQLIIIGVIILELVAPMVIMGYTFDRKASLVPFFKPSVGALMLFTLMATVLYHNPMKSRDSYYSFMSDISTFGGLWALFQFA